MTITYDNQESREYFDDIQGYYQGEEKREDEAPIGRRLAEIRKMQNISLEQFARITGIPQGKLREIEEQKILPDLGTIVKLSKALRIGTSFLLGEESGYSYSVVRKKERQKISRVSTGSAERPNYQYQSLSHGVRDKHMETFVITLSPGAGSPELSSHDGEEFLVVMEGSIKVILGDKEEFLNEGDSIYYHATVPHNVLNAAGRDNAVIMAVLYTG